VFELIGLSNLNIQRFEFTKKNCLCWSEQFYLAVLSPSYFWLVGKCHISAFQVKWFLRQDFIVQSTIIFVWTCLTKLFFKLMKNCETRQGLLYLVYSTVILCIIYLQCHVILFCCLRMTWWIFRNSDQLIPHIFNFLVLLSYERYHTKTIMQIPKIIQLCDGIMASEQDPATHGNI